MKFVFVTDASTDVADKIKQKYNIEIVPIELRFGDEIFPEGLDNKQFYSKVRTSSVMPKTSMPNAYKFEQIYQKYCNKPDVFVFTIVISMDLSQTKLQAQMAAENLGMKNVFIDEGRGATIFTGAIIGELARYAEKVDDVEKVKQRFYVLRDKVRLYGIIGDLKYLRASGRLSGASATIGAMLKVRPICAVKDGKVLNVAKFMGDAKAESYLLDLLKNMDTSLPIYILNTNSSKAAGLVEKYKKIFPPGQELFTGEVGYVIGTHIGPDCYGLCWFDK